MKKSGPFYYLMYSLDGHICDTVPIGEIQFNDITEIDLLTSLYTEDEFKAHLQQRYPRLQGDRLELFIVRVKKEAQKHTWDVEGKDYPIFYRDLKVYCCLFKPMTLNEQLNDKIVTAISSLAESRKQKILNRSRDKRIDTRLDGTVDPYFEILVQLLLTLVTSNNITRRYVASSGSIVDYKVKEYLQQCYMQMDYKRLSKGFREKLKYYKTLRGLLVEWMAGIQGKVDRIQDENQNFQDNYAFPYSFFGFPGYGYLTIDEANYGYTVEEIPYSDEERLQK